jgi:hypothetical protein
MKIIHPIAALMAATALTSGFSAAQPAQQASGQGNQYRPAYKAEPAAGDTALLPADPPPPGFEASTQNTRRPSDDEIRELIEDARTEAIIFAESLPNLICQQTTSRSEDAHGGGNWKHRDSIVESLSYVDKEESRTTLGGEVNGRKVSAAEMRESGMYSAGEFGEALVGVFAASARAEMEWKGSGAIGGDPVEVFEYRVQRENSGFWVRGGPTSLVNIGYHGEIYIDQATHGVRRLTMITDDLPKGFPIRRAAVRIDYDYVAIEDHNYLLPVSAQVVMGYGKTRQKRNELEFSDFQRFGSTSRVVASTPPAKGETPPETHP